jgi:hypothetical protein
MVRPLAPMHVRYSEAASYRVSSRVEIGCPKLHAAAQSPSTYPLFRLWFPTAMQSTCPLASKHGSAGPSSPHMAQCSRLAAEDKVISPPVCDAMHTPHGGHCPMGHCQETSVEVWAQIKTPSLATGGSERSQRLSSVHLPLAVPIRPSSGPTGRRLALRHQQLCQELMAANGIGGITCRHAAHWQRVWYMLVGLLRTSRSSRAASRRDRPSAKQILVACSSPNCSTLHRPLQRHSRMP